jgi:hypothetical protein
MEVSAAAAAAAEIQQVQVGKPHVVILGAGASYAAFPNKIKGSIIVFSKRQSFFQHTGQALNVNV